MSSRDREAQLVREKRLLEVVSYGDGLNLDCMTYEDLATFAQMSLPSEQLALALWPNRRFTDEVYVAVVRLRAYAIWKADATRARENGAIGAALGLEAECDAMYKRLPEWARW